MKRPPEYHDVDLEMNGTRHQGSYTLTHACITVRLVSSQSTQLGGSAPECLARMLLRERVAESPSSGA